jgi:hypothetical protein
MTSRAEDLDRQAEVAERLALLVFTSVDALMREGRRPGRKPPHPFAEVELAALLTGAVWAAVRPSHGEAAEGYLAQLRRYVAGECDRRYSFDIATDLRVVAVAALAEQCDPPGETIGSAAAPLARFWGRVAVLRDPPWRAADREQAAALEALMEKVGTSALEIVRLLMGP